jgi:predicted DNA-binding transcriptional regulator YafY
MRASRLLSLLILLQMRGRVSASELAREFEVSVRTVYRDADALSAAGVPIYAERGRSGGFRLLDDFRTRLAAFSAREAEALALGGVTQAASDLGWNEGAAAHRKVLANLPASTGAGASRVAERFHLDPLPWYGRRSPPSLLQEVAAAVWSDRRLRMAYESWDGETRRTVAPLGLVMKAGAWYLVAAAGDKPRTYRVDAIRSVEVLDAAAPRPERFDLARYWVNAARAFEDRLIGAPVRVRLSPTGLRLLRDFHPRAWEALQRQRPKADRSGWVVGTIPFEQGSQGVREALRMGTEMEVLAPDGLRRAIAAEAERIAAGLATPAGSNRRRKRRPGSGRGRT